MSAPIHPIHSRIINDRLADSIIASKAEEADTPGVQALLLQTAKWLRSKGSTQWNALLRGEDTHNTADSILSGDVYLFKEGGELAGMVTLLRAASAWDKTLWGGVGHEGTIYLHRLAINRAYGGRGLGASILRWVDHGIRFDGARRIRLDCIASNERLNSFYRAAGYTYRGTSDTGYCLYEKNVPS